MRLELILIFLLSFSFVVNIYLILIYNDSVDNQKDLIDEIILTSIPIILGKGIPLFGQVNKKLKFIHFSTVNYNNSLVKSHYKRDRTAD